MIPSISTGGEALKVVVSIQGHSRTLTVYTGAELSLLKAPIQDTPVIRPKRRARGVTGRPLRTMGDQFLNCTLDGVEVEHRFAISLIDLGTDRLLGLDLLKKFRATINLGEEEVRLTDPCKGGIGPEVARVKEDPNNPRRNPDSKRKAKRVSVKKAIRRPTRLESDASRNTRVLAGHREVKVIKLTVGEIAVYNKQLGRASFLRNRASAKKFNDAVPRPFNMPFQHQVVHKPGRKHTNVDALSQDDTWAPKRTSPPKKGTGSRPLVPEAVT